MTELFALALGFVTVLVVALGFTFCWPSVEVLTFCLEVAFVVGFTVVGRLGVAEGFVVVVVVVVGRLVAVEVAGLAVVPVVAGRVVVVEGLAVVVAGREVVVEGLVVAVVGRPCVEGVRLIFCCALW